MLPSSYNQNTLASFSPEMNPIPYLLAVGHASHWQYYVSFLSSGISPPGLSWDPPHAVSFETIYSFLYSISFYYQFSQTEAWVTLAFLVVYVAFQQSPTN